jgi:DNA-3-methyladenine glycosylase II
MTIHIVGKRNMLARIDTDADIATGLAGLMAADPRFEKIAALAGPIPLRRRAGGFAGLAAIVMSQQLSTASAAAIWGRLSAAFDPFDPKIVRRARADKLKRIGLSAPKIRTLRAIAKAIEDGSLDFDAIAALPADEAHARLTAVHGIGPWTADIYLLGLGHPDAWPAGDLALQEAARIAFGLKLRPTAKEMIPLAEHWRPWRGIAARVLWSYYRATKGREAAPVQPTTISTKT